MRALYAFFSLILFTLLFFFNFTFASVPEGITVTKNISGYQLNFNLPSYEMSPIYAEGDEYINLTIPGYGVTPEVGLPTLPLISFNLFIAYDEEQPEFEITNLNYEEETLPHKIFPFQIPWEKNKSLSDRPFTINREYYNSKGKSNLPAISISEPFIIAGVKGVVVTVYPFSYNPVENKLKVLESGTFRILLDKPVVPAVNKSKNLLNFCEKIFINFDGTPNSTVVRYLIITAPEFETGMQQYANHKTVKGFEVAMFNTNATGTTNTSIKNFIQQRYNDLQTRPEFILLVGDVIHIPAWTGSGSGTPTTDLNYVQLEGGDYFADAFIGRFSVTGTDELQNAIDKSIFMENYIGTLNKKNVFMASTDNWQISEGTHNHVIDNYFGPANYTNLKLYTYTYNATTQQLIDALNDNQVLAVYSGHGGTYSWADGPQLSQSQVEALTNTWYPFVYSFACVTGSYHVSECFGETWLRTENGASTFYGSSVNSYWDEDDVLEKNIFKAMFVDDLTLMTPMFVKGMIYLVNHYGGITGTTLRYMEMYNLMGDPSMPVIQQIPPDTTPPDPITDLTAVNPTSNSITLNWSAPFDSTFGGIETYDIRYSLTMINNDNDFNSAPQKLLTGQSDTAGTPKAFAIDELGFNTTYYFAVKAKDIWGNTSEMSNVPNEITYSAPELALSIDSLHCVVLPNSTHTDSILISNVSVQNSTLDYSIELTNNTFPDEVFLKLVGLIRESQSSGKTKENPLHFGGFSFKGSGGPDLFGYEWIDSNEPNGPEYLWNDISSTGNEITNWLPTGSFDPKDEGTAGPIPIGFDFKFYGETKSQVYVNTNGVISFINITENIFSNDAIPTAGIPDAMIAPFWDDLDGRTQGNVYYKQESDKFIIQFTNWQKYSGTGSLTFQIVLKSNNRIYLYYENMAASLNSCTVGIENYNGTDGLQIAYNAGYIENQLAVLIASDPEWLTLSDYAGRLYNGNTSAIVLNIVTDELQMGDYSMDMEVVTNDPNNTFVVIPITMTITNEIPVELASLNAENYEDEIVISWQTATETNNLGFAVERIYLSNSDWNEIGFVPGFGTTTEPKSYSFTDDIISSGTYKYRLKQIDLDGTVSYSSELEVEVNGPNKFALYQNYPNPFNPSTTIKFAIPEKTSLELSVYNSLGEKVVEVFKGELDEGYHQIEFSATNFSSGIYLYRLESKNFVSVKKMILIK
ncbi:MAG: T9SS type A sorting domain-containing protein [Ignavibacteriaceae bacterium]|nr:T9SS type A sorting domain-containing protein [Ignavibacteria bacterium]NNJ52741.1 T9SS type A sorting domain-containing protein [Ignavibacteriaceae bacterium]NNL21636.1 T9SS type A sorting domain-containing protein [Ignavibacteriaceae bacterium]